MKHGRFHSPNMLDLAACVIVVICCQSVFAQLDRKGAAIVPAVTIESFDWYLGKPAPSPRFVRSYGLGLPEGQSRNFPQEKEAAPGRSEKFVYRLRVRNLSDEKVIGVVWRYEFIDPITKAPVASHEFATRTDIPPRKRKTIYAESFSPPTASVDVKLYLRNRRRPFLESAVVKSVSFVSRPRRFAHSPKRKK